MEKREVVGCVLERDVIRDDVTLESRRERLAQVGVGIEEQFVLAGVDENEPVGFPLGGEDTRHHREIRVGFAHVIRHLAIQVTDAIGAGQAQLRARREIKEHRRPLAARRAIHAG